MKVARFIREMPQGGWWVKQYLFKVTPPMEWDDSVTYRKGKLLHDKCGKFPNRLRIKLDSPDGLRGDPDLNYSYGSIRRSTAFVIASAADLGAMMEKSYEEIREKALIKGDLRTLKIFSKSDSTRFKPETYLFPCDKFGIWKSGGELPGSQRGTLDHRLPFEDQGYAVIGMPEIKMIEGRTEYVLHEGEQK